jgi:hypothetical protein
MGVTPNSVVQQEVITSAIMKRKTFKRREYPNILNCEQLHAEDEIPASKEYDLSHNLVGDRGAIALIDAVRMNKNVERISLRCFDSRRHIFLFTLPTNETCGRGNNIRNKACVALADLLHESQSVTECDLRDNVISTTGIVYYQIAHHQVSIVRRYHALSITIIHHHL